MSSDHLMKTGFSSRSPDPLAALRRGREEKEERMDEGKGKGTGARDGKR